MRYCFMYDDVFYNVCPGSYHEEDPISEVMAGSFLVTFYDKDEAEGAKFEAYARRLEYEESGLDIPALMEIIPILEVVAIDEDCKSLINNIYLEMVPAYD